MKAGYIYIVILLIVVILLSSCSPNSPLDVLTRNHRYRIVKTDGTTVYYVGYCAPQTSGTVFCGDGTVWLHTYSAIEFENMGYADTSLGEMK